MSAPPRASAVATHGLGKRYGDHAALTDVDLAVPTGSVYGLVGPNGAGKTTLLSILAGLRSATAGTVESNVDRGRVAVVPDTPQFDPWLTGREVVDLARHLVAPDAPAAGVDQSLTEAGLAGAADRRVGGYSRGMLQRLGLAAALVGDPQLLILDEPSSALDPAGRRDVLNFVAAARGRATVLFSSHILGDVQEVSDTVGILREGRLLFQGPLNELLVGRAAPGFEVRVRGGADRISAALRDVAWVACAEPLSDDTLRIAVRSTDEAEQHLAGELARSGARLVSVIPVQSNLEQVFLELTS